MNAFKKSWYLLVFVGLLTQSSTNCAWNMPKINLGRVWPTVKTLGSRFVNSRYFVPAAALALIVACGYISYKSEAAEYDYYDDSLIPQPEISRTPAEPHAIQLGTAIVQGQQMQLNSDDQPVLVQQVPVLNQFGRNAGGGASCGYQALKNACAITSMVLGNHAQNWHEWLASPEQAIHLFGLARASARHGIWREIVMRERDKRALQYYIKTLVPVALIDKKLARQFNVERIRSLFVKLSGDYIDSIVTRICEAPGSKIDISLQSCIDWIQAHAQDIEITDSMRYGDSVSVDEIQQFIKNPEIIRNYIGLDPTAVIICSQAMLADARKAYNSGSRNGHSYNGEWLHQGDIHACRDYVRREYAHLRDVPIVVLDSRIRHTEFNDEVFENIRSAIQERKPLPQQIYAFIVGNMRHSGEGGSQGHWTTLILDAQRQDLRRYLIADSAGGNALRGGACMDLIRYFEGPSKDYRSRVPVEHEAPIQAPKSSRLGRMFDSFLDWLDPADD
ncbi:MAG TPA: hypothetical protein PKD74_04330 [Candidatus Dependentiae bacterium]|nr:hypothetical protein [Candidatus Dependentiae bacterium]